ncbi:MAG: hydroxylamine reductase [Deltaproteobacteria bacterium]|nr:hydroxylamine reductase [Deltaproteobacteria bacterium]
MFCNQCEQTAKGTGCTVMGVCGKQPDVAALQDLLVHVLVGLGAAAREARKAGITDNDADRFVLKALFATLTNVNFDAEAIEGFITEADKHRRRIIEKLTARKPGRVNASVSAAFEPDHAIGKKIEQAKNLSPKDFLAVNEDVRSLKQLLLYGMKGVAAYADHAGILGYSDDGIAAFLYEGLTALGNPDLTIEEALDLVLRCGETNLAAMKILDQAHTETYGHPMPTGVPLGHKKGKAILVSGHDLKDLEALLKQTEGTGINIYTHGEMLPAHGYPGLKKYGHLYGHYGTAWQNQAKEFEAFPGAIVMTTNCIQQPRENYKDRIFTAGVVGWPGVAHIQDGDFGCVIEMALNLPGFPEDADLGVVTAGFARQAVLSVADKIIAAVKSGKIRHFFLVGGCDGAKPGRNYYTKFVESVPRDCVVLTLACGKFRFFDKDMGTIDGIPRLLDLGQCNDAYSAVAVATALAEAFGVGVNDLPLSLILSWYEQKAVSILLTLLALGIKNIRLGPSLPAFVTPAVLQTLVEKFNIMPISTPENDLRTILK